MTARKYCPVIGIGASAGGLDALRRLLGALPADAPFAIVVVQHLDASRKSSLAKLLASATAMTVIRAEGGQALAPGTVYVVPEGREARVADGTLSLHVPEKKCVAPIDVLFTSMATTHPGSTAAVLLSGMGSDGVEGLRDVRASGGMALVQDPASAEYDEMPRAAVASGVADVVAPPEELAVELLRVCKHPYLAGTTPRRRTVSDADSAQVREITELLRDHVGMDFSGYKATTVSRRAMRRAMLRGCDGLPSYRKLLESDPAEVAALYDDLLINVTQFFRDPEVFDVLKSSVFPKMLEGKTDQDTLRLWIAGCSTGEEVYSILIALMEVIEASPVTPKVVVFGTDAGEGAIGTARAGRYSGSVCRAVSPDRLARFFTPTGDSFQVSRALRECCVFARHDVTRDTPFSRLDLVSLRNVLIYMEAELQRTVLAVAHFALVPKGFLVLGTAETPDNGPQLFTSFAKGAHVYRRRNVPARLPLDLTAPARTGTEVLATVGPEAGDAREFDVEVAANRLSVLTYTPPRVIVDDGLVTHFFGDTSAYLSSPSGKATLDVLELVRRELLLDLKDALDQSEETGTATHRESGFGAGAGRRRVGIDVLPITSPEGRTYRLVAFRDIPLDSDEACAPSDASEDVVAMLESREQRLHRELGASRGQLRDLSDEKSRTDAALRAANEEIRSSNEELQSINEELETAKEELQSSNDELVSVNEELQIGNVELAAKNADVTWSMQQLEHRDMLSRALNDIDARLHSKSDMSDILQGALDAFVQTLAADAGDVKVLGPDGWTVTYQKGFVAEDVGQVLTDVDAPVAVRVADTRQPVIVKDYTLEPELSPGFPRAHNLTATLATPLIVRDEVVGALFAHMTTGPRSFTNAEVDFARRMATSVSIAMDNARLLAAERVRVARVEAINEMTNLTLSALDPRQVAERGLRFLVEHLGVSAAAAWQVSDHGTIEMVASANFPQEYVEFTRSLPIDADLDNVKVAVTGETIVAEDLASWNRDALKRFAALGAHVGAYAIVPIRSGAGVIGVLGLSWSAARRIPQEDIDFYQALAAQLGLSLENARLFEAEKRELERTQLLQDLTQSVANEVDPSVVAEAAISTLRRHLGMKIADVRALDDDGQELVLLVAHGVSDDVVRALERLPVTASGYLATRALQAKRLMTHEDEVLTPERAALGERTGVADDRYVQIPLIQQGKAVGTVGLVFEGRRSFTDEELRLYRVVAGILAQAIQSAKLFQAEKLRAARMEALRDVAALVASSLEPAEVIVSALTSIVDHVGVNAASVWLYDETLHRMRLEGALGFPDEFLVDYAGGIDIDVTHDLGTVVRTGKLMVYENAEAPDSAPEVVKSYRGYGLELGALIVLPLRVGHEVIGAVALSWEEPRRFDEDSLAFDTSLADTFSTALANARLFEDVRESGKRVAEIVESMNDAFVTVDRDWHYKLVNARAAAMLGRTAEYLLDGVRMDEEFPDVTGWPYYRQAMEERVPVRFESYVEMAHSWVEVHAYPTLDGISMYVSDITARRNAEEQIRRDAGILAGINSILEASLSAGSLEELGKSCLTVAQEVTSSAFGFVGEITELGLLHDVAISDPGWDECTMLDKSGHLRVLPDFEIRGLYGRVLSEGASLFTNSPGDHPHSIGTPKGHPELTAFLGTPLLRQGQVVGMVAVGNAPSGYSLDDVTAVEALAPVILQALERKRAAQLLAETRGRADSLAELVENASLAFAAGGFSGQLLLANHAFEELTGYTGDELREIDWATDLTPPEYGPMEAEALATLTKTGEPVRYEKEYIRKDGTRVPIELLVNLAHDEDGKPAYYYSFITDTTERRLAQERLDQANRLLEAHIGNSPLAVVEFDSEFHVSRWSDGAERMFGWSAEEVLGKGVTEFKWIYEEDAALVDDESEGLSTGASPRSFNTNRNYRKDGSVIWCEWYDSAIYDDDGTLVSIFSQVLDITGRRAAEEAVRNALAEVDAERTRLRQIIDEIPIGVAVLGSDGTVLEANEELVRIWGGKMPQVAAVEEFTAFEGYHHDTNERLRPADWPGPRAMVSRRPESSLVDMVRVDDKVGVSRVSAVPIFDEAGALTRVVVIVEDVTEQVHAEQLTRALNEISLEVASSLDDGEIIRILTERGREALGTESAGAVIRHGGHWIVDVGIEVRPEAIGQPLTLADARSMLTVFQETEPLVLDDARQDERVLSGRLSDLGAESVIAVPLISHGTSAGALIFWQTGRRRGFSSAQVEFARKLMTVATSALDNAHLYQREHRIAEVLQEAILTPPEPVDGLDISYLYRPASDVANVGGDFYDLIPVTADRVGLVVGDVSGKGIEAARFTTLMKDGTRAFLLEGADPASALERLNSLAWRSTPVERFATAFVGVLDVATGALSYCGAGHPSAVVLAENTSRVLESCSGVLGAWEGLSLTAGETTLAPGDVLVMCTDGVTEARREGELFGEERLRQALDGLRGTPASDLPQALLDAVLEFSGGGLRDDVVILCAARKL